MAKDKIGDHYDKKKQKSMLGGLSKRTVDPDLLDEEQEMLEKTEPVEPIKVDKQPGRNDPCPCGSGKKYKKCCYGKKE